MPNRIPFEEEVPRVLAATADQESHVEPDTHTFHPSQLAYCRRQAYIKKFGLSSPTRALGTFRLGTLLHSKMVQWFATRFPHLEFEKRVTLGTDSGIQIVGHADCYDPREDVVYDFKTRANWYRLHRPIERHRDQVEPYMRGIDATHGQIVYISKKNLEIRFDPQLYSEDVTPQVVNMDPIRVAFTDDDTGGILHEQPEPSEPTFFEQSQERFESLLAKAHDIREAVLENGIASTAGQIPFDPCGCYPCQQERLSFADVPEIRHHQATGVQTSA